MKKLFGKKETIEGEVIELTPEERKEKRTKILKKVGIGFGALTAFAAGMIFGSNAVKSNSEGDGDESECSCDCSSESDPE